MNVFLNSLRLSQFFLCVFLLWSTCVIDAAEPDTQAEWRKAWSGLQLGSDPLLG